MARRAAPAPPKLAPKPGVVKVYKAMWAYTAQHVDELTFEEGDRIYITDQSESGWWKATVKGKAGLVPSNYVAEDIADAIDFPLHEAAKRGNLSFLLECLDNKIAINAADKSGSTALYWAAHGGHVECVDVLINNNFIELNHTNKLGDTPLHAAAWKSHPDVIKLLLHKGANNQVKNKDNKTPMDLASDPECAALLKPRGRGSVGSSNDEYLGDSD
ncbi:osteoclast-stimulating factor 1-like [Clavelina lepadiformis]|uniref:osteoclast-stimulating factor 1-like n=1 Tax=Clavelina lepadiformis TaxID=159417 RepID=UPI004042F205